VESKDASKSGPIVIDEPFSVSYKILPDGPIKIVRSVIKGTINWVSLDDLKKELKFKIDPIPTSEAQTFGYKVKNNGLFEGNIIGIQNDKRESLEEEYIDNGKTTCLDPFKGKKELESGKECELWLKVPKDKEVEFNNLELFYIVKGAPGTLNFTLKKS
jgi:hypothetical protein